MLIVTDFTVENKDKISVYIAHSPIKEIDNARIGIQAATNIDKNAYSIVS